MFFIYLLLAVVGIPFLVMLVSVIIGIPCLPTHKKQAEVLIELCGIEPGMKVVDLGSGHGRLVILAAKKGAQVTGYELNPFLVFLSRYLIRKEGLSNQAKIYWRTLFKSDISEADVVMTFLFQRYMDKLENGLFSTLKKGAKVVSYTFPVKGWNPVTQKEGVSVYQKSI